MRHKSRRTCWITCAILALCLSPERAGAQQSNAAFPTSSVSSPNVYRPPHSPPMDNLVDYNLWPQRLPSIDTVFAEATVVSEDWVLQPLPGGLIYKAYLAGAKESRFGTTMVTGDSSINGHDWLHEGTLGARVGVLRFGTTGSFMPQGIQLDAEGSAQLRLNYSDDLDVQATDYRAGAPLTFGFGRSQFKLAYYHLSSHLGDEFLLKHRTFERLNFVRDVIVVGYSFYPHPNYRFYGEAGWAFNKDVSRPWEFQFGFDYAPAMPTGMCGAPFFAINAHLRQEVNYGGNLTVQTGWAWRSDQDGRLLRIGFHYLNGESPQFSFFDYFEEQFGVGMWYDF